jgi:hypothetical protein
MKEPVMAEQVVDQKADVNTNGTPLAPKPAGAWDPATWTWRPEVLAFAQEAGVSEYLDPLLKATHELFPDAPPPRVSVDEDPEIVNLRNIMFELDIPFTSVDDYSKEQRRWIDALCRVCPAPLTCTFCLLLIPVAHGPA